MNSNWQIKIDSFFTKAIVFNLYVCAFSLFISKKLTNASAFLVCLFGLFQLIIMRENPLKKIKDNALNLAIIFFIFAMIVSFIGNPYARVFFKIFLYLFIFLFFYITVSNLQNLNQVKNLLVLASVSMGISVMVGTYQHFFLKISRTNGLLLIASFGSFLAIFIIFLITYCLWGKINIGYRIALFMGTVFLGVNLLFNQTRGAWLSLLGGVFTIGWLKNKKLLAPFLIICLLLYLFLPQMYVDRFESIFNTETNTSNLSRITLWKCALLMYREHFINGVGLGRYGDEYKTNYPQYYSKAPYSNPHSNILKYMAETGTIGLVAFVWLMGAVIIWLYKNYRQITDPQWHLFPFASLCAIVAFNINGLTESNFGGTKNADAMLFFWLLIALNVVIVNLCEEKK